MGLLEVACVLCSCSFEWYSGLFFLPSPQAQLSVKRGKKSMRRFQGGFPVHSQHQAPNTRVLALVQSEQMHHIYQTSAWVKDSNISKADFAVTPGGLTPISVKKLICYNNLSWGVCKQIIQTSSGFSQNHGIVCCISVALLNCFLACSSLT